MNNDYDSWPYRVQLFRVKKKTADRKALVRRFFKAYGYADYIVEMDHSLAFRRLLSDELSSYYQYDVDRKYIKPPGKKFSAMSYKEIMGLLRYELNILEKQLKAAFRSREPSMMAFELKCAYFDLKSPVVPEYHNHPQAVSFSCDISGKRTRNFGTVNSEIT